MDLDPTNPQPGLYEGLSYPQYDQIRAVNRGLLSRFLKTPAHARAYQTHPQDDTPALLMGRAVHKAVLEPSEFLEEYAKAPIGDKRTKAVKAEWAALEAERPDAEILRAPEWTQCLSIQRSVWAHPTAKELLTGQGRNEVTVVGRVGQGETMAKIRLDRLTEFGGYGTIVDLKTCQDASPYAFAKDIAKHKYHFQAAFYLDVLRSYSEASRRFVLVAVEKEPPYAVACYEIEPMGIEQGRNDWKACLEAYETASAKDEWPAYPVGVSQIELPAWAIRADEWLDTEAAL